MHEGLVPIVDVPALMAPQPATAEAPRVLQMMQFTTQEKREVVERVNFEKAVPASRGHGPKVMRLEAIVHGPKILMQEAAVHQDVVQMVNVPAPSSQDVVVPVSETIMQEQVLLVPKIMVQEASSQTMSIEYLLWHRKHIGT